MKKLILPILALLFAGCSTHRVSLDNGYSELYIELSGAMQTAEVQLNGERVFQGKNVQVIRLKGIESGTYDLRVIAFADNRKGHIDHSQSVTLIDSRQQIELESPGFTSKYYAVMGFTMITSLAISHIFILK